MHFLVQYFFKKNYALLGINQKFQSLNLQKKSGMNSKESVILETIYTYILDSHTYVVGYILPDLTRRGLIFSYKRGRLPATSYRSGAAGRCCRRREDKNWGKDKNWENHRDRERNLRILCVPPSAQNCFPEEARNASEREETEGGGKHWDPSSELGELEDTRGL